MRYAARLDKYFNDGKALSVMPPCRSKDSWRRKDCPRLYDDLLKVHERGLFGRFFGSTVAIRAGETANCIHIIDGQQGMTVLSLLVLAATNAVRYGDMSTLRFTNK